MGKIVLLDELTINKIAAGEVIERPASVVKELIENSIDAGAKNISIEIENGGIAKIRIIDDGKGIEPDDMKIAFERHATSKIRVADDLEAVRTMGFRGEALASIGAISKVTMVSRTEDSETGYKVVVEAGNIVEEDIVACPVGTNITIEKLFFNTPVRYKFLKKDYTELGYIEDVVIDQSLINTDIAIKLTNNGKVIIKTNGSGDLKNVVYSIFGKDISEAILEVNYKLEDMEVTGVVGKPEIARSNRSNQIFYVNKRFVKDKTLLAAADQAFKGMLPIGKFGFLILNLSVTPKKVDVNVHPAKLEVRFTEEGNVYKAVMYAIKEGLLSNSLVSNINSLEMAEDEKIETTNKAKEANKEIHEQVEVKERKFGLVDLFKKVSKDAEKDYSEYKEDNLIEHLYNAKYGIEGGNRRQDGRR